MWDDFAGAVSAKAHEVARVPKPHGQREDENRLCPFEHNEGIVRQFKRPQNFFLSKATRRYFLGVGQAKRFQDMQCRVHRGVGAVHN
jgi:hypothetical protein